MITQYGNTMFPMDAFATFSDDYKYRYKLGRRVQSGSKGTITWCILNPSTATAFLLDPTIRKCMEFSKRWNFSYMFVVNLFAYRATNPKELYKVKDPVGNQNWQNIREAFDSSEMIIVGWGAEKIVKSSKVYYEGMKDYFEERNVLCLGTNKDGSPKHPLYLPYTTPLRNFKLC